MACGRDQHASARVVQAAGDQWLRRPAPSDLKVIVVDIDRASIDAARPVARSFGAAEAMQLRNADVTGGAVWTTSRREPLFYWRIRRKDARCSAKHQKSGSLIAICHHGYSLGCNVLAQVHHVQELCNSAVYRIGVWRDDFKERQLSGHLDSRIEIPAL